MLTCPRFYTPVVYRYVRNGKMLCNLFKDQPMSPAEYVVFWTEYVVCHKEAPPLKSYAFDLTWYQYFMLDEIFVVVICAFIVLFVTRKVLETTRYEMFT